MGRRVPKVIVIEDSDFFAKVMRKLLVRNLGVEVLHSRSLAEARSLIEQNRREIALAIVDLNLPDSTGNDSVQLTSAHGIPSIVFSGNLDPERREDLFKLGVVDSLPKDSPASLDYATALAGRVLRNADLVAMVVEDSDMARRHVGRLLERQGLRVQTASNGFDALSQLTAHPDLRLMLVDYEMPRMSGFELIRQVRRTHSSQKLGIIGMSANAEPELVTRFMKSGANDFIHKPFGYEELLCRATQNLEMLDHIERFETMAVRDFLTGLHNRRHLFDVGETLHANAVRDSFSIAVGMIDIDFFKKVNDTHGHDAGDAVLKATAETLKEQFRGADVVARMGGEEFCVVGVNMGSENAVDVFDRARQALRDRPVEFNGKAISVTMSAGVCTDLLASFEAMINSADTALYEAKQSGRDRVVVA